MSSSLQPHGLWPTRLLCPWDFPGRNTGVGCHAVLQGTFPTRGSNLRLLCLLHCQAGSLPELSWINVNKTQNRIGAWTRGRLVSDLDVFGISLQFNLRSCGIKFWIILCSNILMSFSGDSVVKNPPANAGDASLIPDWGRPPGKRNGSPVQYSCLENPMDRGAW